jgi:hypothetical protein
MNDLPYVNMTMTPGARADSRRDRPLRVERTCISKIRVMTLKNSRVSIAKEIYRRTQIEKSDRSCEFASEMVHSEVCAVGTQLLGRDGKLDGLEQRVGRGAYLRTVRITPVPERQEPDLLQHQIS